MGQIKVLAFDLMGVILTEKNIDNPIFQDIDSHIDLEDSGFYQWANSTYQWSKSESLSQLYNFFENYYFVRDPAIFNLSSQYKFALASNHLSAIKIFLKKQNILKYFSSIVISSEIGFKKPNPKFFEILINKINISPQNILFIDDNQENTESAQSLGLNVFNFNKNHDQSNLRQQIELELLKYQ